MWSNIFMFSLALVYENIGEWFFHRYVLHGLGCHRESFWSYHWYGHHEACRNGSMYDAGYGSWPRNRSAQVKELFVLAVILLFHSPFFFFIPGFALGFYFSILLYYYKHRRAHLDDVWARKHLGWHYDHHMNPNPRSANWCISWPWFDYVMGTRIRGI